jgi:Xaa-Pro aminopeptidase
MSNWKACIPANPKYEGAKNAFWVTNVSVSPHEAVSVRVQVHYQNGALANEFVTISGDEYKEWAADDDWIYHKVATKLALGHLADSVDASGNPVQYIPAPVAAIDDTRSVHNEADIQRIQTLQEQLDAQAAKLKTITELLFKNGAL